MTLKMGNIVRDTITGFQGIMIGRTDWLYGCSRIGIEPTDLDKDGKPRDPAWFDEQRIVTVEDRSPPVSPESRATTGGPRDDGASRRADPSR